MNIIKEINKAKAWVELVPLIIAFIRGIEEALPGDGLGQIKIALFRDWLASVWSNFSGFLGSLESNLPAVEAFVTATIATFNRLGFFKKKDAK